jgi:phospho-N-acetylmuramoyl-pentapeptide-transferase
LYCDLSNLSYKIIHSLLAPFAFALIFTVVLLPLYIKWLKRFQIEQFVREEGPASHAVKARTPTTGGVVFIVATLFGAIIWSLISHSFSKVAIAVIVLSLLCALLGGSDDMAKVMNKTNRGLSASARLLLELLFGALFGLALLYAIPFGEQHMLAGMPHDIVKLLAHCPDSVLAIAFLLFSAFLVAATSNALNLHDGMDGLAAGTALSVFLCLALMLIMQGNIALALIALSCAGALAGFLFFNCYPAKIFMGDVGSLFIGGLLASLVLSSGLVIWFIPLSLIYILETLSVIVQVSYFKLTKPYNPPQSMNTISLAWYKLTHKLPGEGRRVFRMAPLHHHFEAVLAEKGIAEWQVVLGFWLVQLLICCIVLAAFLR